MANQFAHPSDQPTPAPLKADLIWVWAVLLPVILLFTTWVVFQLAAMWVGQEAGYLIGFTFYWLFWCLLVPGMVTGKQGLVNLLTDQRALFSRENWLAALLWGVVMLVAIWMYWSVFSSAPKTLILLAIPLATINGVCEEVLWRGLYVRAYSGNPWLAIVCPSIGFALWHIAPQTIYPAENSVGFLVSTLFLGQAYGYIAYRTSSARWTAISHSLNGILALSGMLAPSLIGLVTG